MNAISYALDMIKLEIPRPILEKVFISLAQDVSRQYTFRPVTIDSAIRDKVIEPKVLVDCNLGGGTEIYVPLLNVPSNRLDPFTIMYTIPKQLTQNRSILSVLSVSYGQGSLMGGTNMGLKGSSPMLDAASGVFASAGPINVISTAYTWLVGENTIVIQDNMAIPNNVFLRCKIENDKNLNSLNPTSFPYFGQFAVYATKGYIHTNSVIEMDRAFLQGGLDLNSFKTVIDGYADAWENYKDYFSKTIKKVFIYNDPESSRRMLSARTGGRF